MAVVCRRCLLNRGLNVPAVRTGSGPCNFCGDLGLLDGKNKPIKVGNFSYPDNLLPGTPQYEENIGGEGEGAGGGGGAIMPATKENK